MVTVCQVFQSTPAIADGRTGRLGKVAADPLMFQSTPAIADGRTALWWASCASRSSFNPRPPSLTGEPRGGPPGWFDREVSIHARHR